MYYVAFHISFVDNIRKVVLLCFLLYILYEQDRNRGKLYVMTFSVVFLQKKQDLAFCFYLGSKKTHWKFFESKGNSMTII